MVAQMQRLFFIGEAPGRSEDKEGKPFVGAAGKFLDEMLSEINLKREDIFITNIVKYRPPNNRDPLPEEKASCREWLLEELKIISPKLIVFLGRHALNNFFPDLQIGGTHGKLLIKKFKDISTKYFLPLYHPAAALRRLDGGDFNGGFQKNSKSSKRNCETRVKKVIKKAFNFIFKNFPVSISGHG